MGTKTVTDNEVLYERDFYRWTEQTARMIRDGRFNELALIALAEEIEDMGKSQKQAVLSKATLLLSHLLKWKYQPERRGSSWQVTIRTQRRELRAIFRDSASLENMAANLLEEIYADAAGDAQIESGLPPDTFPHLCPLNFQLMLSDDFWPD